jgi:signal transduction histidine kinase
MKPFASLRSRALLVILLATLPLLASVIDGYRHERSVALQAIEEDLHTIVRSALIEDAEIAEVMELMLRIMANADEMRAPTPAGCAGLARRLMKVQPHFTNMGAAWPDGDLFCTALPTQGNLNVSDRLWFQKSLTEKKPSGGHYLVGRISGQRTVVYGYPRLGVEGTKDLVLFAGVRLDWFANLLRNMRLSENRHALIVTRDGQVAARFPAEGSMPYLDEVEIRSLLEPLPDAPLARTMQNNGIVHLHVIAPVSSARDGLYVIAGTDMRQALQALDIRFRGEIALAVAIALLSALLAWFALHRSVIEWAERMGAALRDFGAGRLTTRAGRASSVSELQSLSASFDAMAERIEHDNEELERRVAERTAALERSNAELGAFAYSVSHDLRAPLRAVAGFGDILTAHHRGQLDPEGQRYLDHIVKAAGHMSRMIDDLLQYSRVGRSEVRSEPVDLDLLCADLLALSQPTLPAGGQIRILGPLPGVRGDERLIDKILAILIDNAAKYQPAGQAPAIALSAAAENGFVTISVADNGIGIAPEYQQKIFDVFQRLHGDEEYPGTGIGLAIARKAAALMGGRLTVQSAPGKGSIFELHLPAA